MIHFTKIKELLNRILSVLERAELEIEVRMEDIQAYIEKYPGDVDKDDLLMQRQKAIKTSIELLREEIDELHQAMVLISSKNYPFRY